MIYKNQNQNYLNLNIKGLRLFIVRGLLFKDFEVYQSIKQEENEIEEDYYLFDFCKVRSQYQLIKAEG